MRRLSVLSAILFFCFIFVMPAEAQITTNISKVDIPQGQALFMAGKIDTTATQLSSEFLMTEFDGKISTTSPLIVGAQLTGGTNSTRKITAILKGSMFRDGTYTAIDTLLFKDSVSTPIRTTTYLNNNLYLRYKIEVVGAAGNISTNYKLLIYAYKEPE